MLERLPGSLAMVVGGCGGGGGGDSGESLHSSCLSFIMWPLASTSSALAIPQTKHVGPGLCVSAVCVCVSFCPDCRGTRRLPGEKVEGRQFHLGQPGRRKK